MVQTVFDRYDEEPAQILSTQQRRRSVMEISDLIPDYGLEEMGLHHLGKICWNLSTPALYEQAIRRYEGQLAHLGPLVVSLGQHTGRAAKDKYIVDEPETTDDIWWGEVN